jgi:hypothetical protein
LSALLEALKTESTRVGEWHGFLGRQPRIVAPRAESEAPYSVSIHVVMAAA